MTYPNKVSFVLTVLNCAFYAIKSHVVGKRVPILVSMDYQLLLKLVSNDGLFVKKSFQIWFKRKISFNKLLFQTQKDCKRAR